MDKTISAEEMMKNEIKKAWDSSAGCMPEILAAAQSILRQAMEGQIESCTEHGVTYLSDSSTRNIIRERIKQTPRFRFTVKPTLEEMAVDVADRWIGDEKGDRGTLISYFKEAMDAAIVHDREERKGTV